MIFLGWILIIIGILFLLLSVASAVTTVLKDILGTLRPGTAGQAATMETTNVEKYTELAKALVEVFKVILSGPTWFIMFVLGVACIIAGVRLISVGTIF